MDYTLTYKDSQVPEARGWTSFWSFIPDGMTSLRNKMFSIKDGQLYVHHSDDVSRNNFYGTDNDSKITLVFNQAPSEIKVMKTLSTEGTGPWSAVIKAFESDQDEYRESTLNDALFIEKEGQWHAYVRKAESTGTIEGSAAYYGIGVTTAASDPNITLGGIVRIPSQVMVGDEIYNDSDQLLGVVVSKSLVNSELVIEIDDTAGGSFASLTPGELIYGKKDLRIDGSEIRGYVFSVELTNDVTTKTELFSVNSDVIKSYQ